MEQESRNRISALYHAALERPPEARSAFLRDACAGDEELRQEVESLLSFESISPDFLGRPAAAFAGAAQPGIAVKAQLGPYTILERLGPGGMAEVYRARDTKLGRDVVIKVLPPQFTQDAERSARFAREARVLATMSHPNIGAIFGLEEVDGTTALVLEFVEGPTLEERLARGPLPLSETLSIARQIAEALEAAHDKGIVHRDLKPANIVLQGTSGAPRVKVLDFGLAKVVHSDVGQFSSEDGTADGRILGTPSYMSPEQARGLSVDKRTDIWAFGCVLFEMLTARRAFEGETLADTIARTLEREPDWRHIERSIPERLRRLLAGCLEKDPERRLHDITDARIELEKIAPPDEFNRPDWWRLFLRFSAIGGVLALVVVTATQAWRLFREPSSNAITVPNGATSFPRPPLRVTFEPGIQTDPSFSPDGGSIAYASNQSGNYDVWVRLLAGGDPRQVTKSDVHEWQPAWSPDGNQLAFRSERDGGGLYIVAATGGIESRLTSFGYEPQWSRDGSRILFFRSFRTIRAGVYTVSPDDKSLQQIDLSKFPFNRFGSIVGLGWHPNGKQILFLTQKDDGTELGLTVVTNGGSEITQPRVDAGVRQRMTDLRVLMAQDNRRLLIAPDLSALYFIAFSREMRSLWKLDLDPRTLDVVGGPHQVVVSTESIERPALSRDGARIAFHSSPRQSRIVTYTLDVSGRRIVGTPRDQSAGGFAVGPELTRDGTQLAFTFERLGGARHIHEMRVKSLVDTNAAERRLVDSAMDRGENRLFLRWSPDGTRLAYRRVSRDQRPGESESRQSRISFIEMRTGEERDLTSPSPRYDGPYGWSADGQFIISSSGRYNPGQNTVALVPFAEAPHAEDKKTILIERSDVALWNAGIAPNEKWICLSVESRPRETSRLAVVRMDGTGWIDISDGKFWDDKPRWSADGRLIYFVSDQGGMYNIWAVEFDPIRGVPGKRFQLTSFGGPGDRILDLDGFELGYGGNKFAIGVSNSSGGIWMLDGVRR